MFKRRKSSNCRLTDRSGCCLELLVPKIQFPKAPSAALSPSNTFSAHLSPTSGVEKATGRCGGAQPRNGDTPTEWGHPKRTGARPRKGRTPGERELTHETEAPPPNRGHPQGARYGPVTPLCLPAPLAGHGPAFPASQTLSEGHRDGQRVPARAALPGRCRGRGEAAAAMTGGGPQAPPPRAPLRHRPAPLTP